MLGRRGIFFSARSRLTSKALLAIALVALVAWGVKLALSPRVANGPGATRGVTPAQPAVVSLLPSATDILISIGCRDHLVAVSDVDADPQAIQLPRVGDLERTDWEKITRLHPRVIVTHFGADHIPAGFLQHVSQIGARNLNLLTETLNGPDDPSSVEYAIGMLGKACNEPAKAADAQARLRSRLEGIRQRATNKPPVLTLIVIGAEGTMVAGRETFLSQLLEMAGGKNAAARLGGRYPNLDREQLLALRPEVVVQLLPGASPAVCRQASQFWKQLPGIPAVRDGRVVQITEWYALLPGYHVADLGEAFERALRPKAAK